MPAEFTLLRFDPNDHTLLEAGADLVHRFSWGIDYPIHPLSELENAEFCVAILLEDRMIAFGAVTRCGSPDGADNGELWLGYSVVLPEFQGRGFYRMIYEQQIGFVSTQNSRVLACTANPVVRDMFARRAWQHVRDTFDEAGDGSAVFEWPRVPAI